MGVNEGLRRGGPGGVPSGSAELRSTSVRGSGFPAEQMGTVTLSGVVPRRGA